MSRSRPERRAQLPLLPIPSSKMYPAGAEATRPRTRADCDRVERPCPWITCRHNLYLDVDSFGKTILAYPDREPGEMPATGSCALDVAEYGGITLEDAGEKLGIVKELVRRIQVGALVKVKRALPEEEDLPRHEVQLSPLGGVCGEHGDETDDTDMGLSLHGDRGLPIDVDAIACDQANRAYERRLAERLADAACHTCDVPMLESVLHDVDVTELEEAA